MSTFSIITPSIVTLKTVNQADEEISNGYSDAAIILGLIGDGVTAIMGLGANLVPNSAINGVIRFGFSLSDAIISLDGNPPISFNSLPAGFTPITAALVLTTLGTPGQIVYLQLDSFTESGAITQDGFVQPPASLAYSPVPSILDIMNNGCGVRAAFTNNDQFVYGYLYSLSGTYSIISFQYTIQTTTPIKPGDHVIIISDPLDSTHLKFDELAENPPGLPPVMDTPPDGPYFYFINSVGLTQYIPIPLINYVDLTETNWEFTVPNIILDNPSKRLVLIVQGNGTQFSGSITLGTFTILYENASGIYRIVKDKRSDTIYVLDSQYTTVDKLLFLRADADEPEDDNLFNPRLTPFKLLLYDLDLDEDENPLPFSTIAALQSVATTVELRIPDPFIETAFIGT